MKCCNRCITAYKIYWNSFTNCNKFSSAMTHQSFIWRNWNQNKNKSLFNILTYLQRWLNCIQNTVLASLSSGVNGVSGEELRTLRIWNSVFTLPGLRIGEIGPRSRPPPPPPPPPPPRRGGDPSRASTLRSRERSRERERRDERRSPRSLLRREDLRSSLKLDN